MRIKLQTLRLILSLVEKLNITEITNINIYGNVKVQYDGGVYDFSRCNIHIKYIDGKLNISDDNNLKTFFRDVLEPVDLDIFYDNLLWLDYLEYMLVEIDGFSTLESIFNFVTQKYFQYYKCTCIDIYYCSEDVHSTIKLFKNSTYSKCYYLSDESGSHARVVRMKPEVFFRNFKDLNIYSLAPNFETPTLAVEVYQLAKYCKLCNFTFNVKEEN